MKLYYTLWKILQLRSLKDVVAFPGWDTNPSQVSSQQTLLIIFFTFLKRKAELFILSKLCSKTIKRNTCHRKRTCVVVLLYKVVGFLCFAQFWKKRLKIAECWDKLRLEFVQKCLMLWMIRYELEVEIISVWTYDLLNLHWRKCITKIQTEI